MCRVVVTAWIATLAVAAGAAGFDDFSWREPCGHTERWTPLADWVSNASPTASVSVEAEVACFAVDEPGRGMKWAASMPSIWLDDLPYLVVRYRAENLDTSRTDYLVYLDDQQGDTELHALRFADVVADGRWHVAAVDVTVLTLAETVHRMAVQVQATAEGKARLWVDWLAMMPAPPDGAEVIEREPIVAAKPDWAAPLDGAEWTAQPSWLGNPTAAGKHRVDRKGETTTFGIEEPQRGMKWSWDLPEPIALEGRRYVSMRYRATGARPEGDYALCVVGKPLAGGPDYLSAIDAPELVCDGRWHTVHVDLRRVATELPTARTLALQLQAAASRATLEVADVRLTNSRVPTRLADAVDWRPGARFDRYRAVAVEPAATAESDSWRRRLGTADWFSGAGVSVEGIPFSLVSDDVDLAATSLRGKSEIRLALDATTSEVYLLMFSAMTGSDEPAYGSGRLRVIRDVDRFRLRLEYADGSADECLPMNVATGRFGVVQGPQVVVAAAEESKRLRAVILRDTAKQAAFAVAAVTVRTGGERRYPEALEESPAVCVKPSGPASRKTTLDAAFDAAGPLILNRLIHGPTGWDCLAGPCPLVELRVDGKPVAPADLEAVDAESVDRSADFHWYAVRSVDGLRLGLDVGPDAEHGLRIRACVRNDGGAEHAVTLVAPSIGPYRLGKEADDASYLVPKRGAVLDHRPCSYRERYCGTFPVQFLDTFSPGDGRGLVLRTADTACLNKLYLLKKENGAFTLGVEYPDRTLKPGEQFTTAPAIVSATDGNWRRGFEAYRRWLSTWQKPVSPRKAWFREIFNFRQRFLWWLDPLYDAGKREFRFQEAVDEARREFGGIDYLHVFDWGNCGPLGRIYGRTGDHSPYQYLGGREAFREALAAVQAQGVPVGLYIEGYLLQERGKLGQQFGPQWQLIGADRKGLYWPESTEMFVCPAVAAWREVQASTYATKVGELDVDGMYLDQFGFAGSGKDCWSGEHGHAVPSYAVASERDTTLAVRRRIEGVKPNVALYTEESPVDVTSQYQDGSFTYAMNAAQRTDTRVPLNVFRFAVPGFKTIEILYCDKPTGSWATGVRWVFFNGEAIWLEGPASEWFEPETLAAIRRSHRVLRKHRDAFTSLAPVPLAPTLLGGVFANAFPTEGKTVYTLYNGRHRTVRGEVLRLRHAPGATYYDEWRERPADVRFDGDDALVSLEIGPHDVGCVVVEHE